MQRQGKETSRKEAQEKAKETLYPTSVCHRIKDIYRFVPEAKVEGACFIQASKRLQ
jgi:hypothetical protein